jgi:type IV pilus assembly protein PilQ
VSWQQVFAVVLEPLNYTYLVEGNIIKIKSQDELAIEPVDTRVFIIDFAKAADLSGSVQPMIDPAAGGKIQVDVRSNALVITERPSRMNDIQEIIETLDRPTEQVMIESKFVEITGREDSSVGVDWQSLIGYEVQVGPMERVYDRIDGRSDSPTRNSQESISTSQDGTSFLSSSSDTGLTEWLDTVTRTDEAIFSADAFNVVLSALETNTDIKLVSNPTIVTMNNKKATINIGEEFPIPNYTYNEERGTFEVSDFEYKNIGINLDVIPQINSAGFINMDIQPEISSRSGQVEFGGASGAIIPIITSRKTNSHVTIKSGFTLAIGGLIEQRDENRISKVPVLGSIPGLGRLFRSDGVKSDQRNLIVFITAKILSASGATYNDVFSKRRLYEMGIKSSDVPGVEASPEEKELYDNLTASRDKIHQLETEIKLREEQQLLDSAFTKEQEADQKSQDPDVEEREIPRRYN